MSKPTPRERFETLSEDERAHWLDAAEQEFSAHGFEKASLNRLIEAAGESKGRTYHYFENKGEIFRAALERRLARIAPLWEAGNEAPPVDKDAYWARLQSLSDRLTDVLQHDGCLSAMIRTLHQEVAAQRAFEVPLRRLRHIIETMLANGQRIGAVRDDLPLALMSDVALTLVVTVDRWFALSKEDLPQEKEAELSRRAFSLLMAPFLPPDVKGNLT